MLQPVWPHGLQRRCHDRKFYFATCRVPTQKSPCLPMPRQGPQGRIFAPILRQRTAPRGLKLAPMARVLGAARGWLARIVRTVFPEMANTRRRPALLGLRL